MPSTARFVRTTLPVASLLLLSAACSDDAFTSPALSPVASHQGHGPAAASVSAAEPGDQPLLKRLAVAASTFVARFIDTPLGEQPIITPSLRIESPSTNGRVRRDEPVTIRASYANFDYRADLRTPNAGATLGSLPQVVTDGYVQGHMHGYLQALPRNGELPDINATSFCVLERVVRRRGYAGIVEGECPGVPAGDYRLSIEFQTNSHTAILKDGPRATPTADVIEIKVR